MSEHACPTEQQLTMFLEGGLSPEDCADIDLHVANCDKCQSASAGHDGFALRHQSCFARGTTRREGVGPNREAVSNRTSIG